MTLLLYTYRSQAQSSTSYSNPSQDLKTSADKAVDKWASSLPSTPVASPTMQNPAGANDLIASERASEPVDKVRVHAVVLVECDGRVGGGGSSTCTFTSWQACARL